MLARTEEFDVELGTLAAQAKAISHPARLEILRFLAAQDTCICGEIVEQLPLAQATVSRHLKVLREAGLINVTQQGLTSCYCVNVEAIGRLRKRFDGFLGEIEDTGPASPC
jgi:ArsR family transcriptional regulator, arsenate/arsenite/antimonite-responsive transcriptional repressor